MIEKPKTSTISAAILAGGNGRRLNGVAKGTIKVGGVSIVQRLIAQLSCAGVDNIVIIANEPAPYSCFALEVVADIRYGIGPMGGIETGLRYFADHSNAVMFIPCDLPNISAKEILALKQAFISTDWPVVFAETSDFFWHPLCAVVHNGLLETISDAIDAGRRKIRDVWKQTGAARVRFDDEEAFFNINSLTDLHEWQNKCLQKRK